jgi:hypothetical protein
MFFFFLVERQPWGFQGMVIGEEIGIVPPPLSPTGYATKEFKPHSTKT